MRADRTSRRFSADPRGDTVTGLVAHEPRKKSLTLVTSDHRHEYICTLSVVSSYTTPRHTPGTRMVAYRAVIGGHEWYGRAAGALLVLRRKH